MRILLNSSLDDSAERISSILSDYLATVRDQSILKWLCITNAYIVLNDYQSALKSLNNYIYFGGVQDPAYNWTSAILYEKVGEYKKALEFNKAYQRQTDDTDMSIFRSDTKFIEERYDAELKSVRQSLFITIVTLTLIIIILVLIIISQRMKRVKEEKRIQKIKFDEDFVNQLPERERTGLIDNKINNMKIFPNTQYPIHTNHHLHHR